MSDIPEHLLRRSAEAKAKALGIPVEQVLAEMKGEAPPTPPPAAPEPAAEPTPEPAAEAAPEAAPASAPEPAPEAAQQPAPAAAASVDYEAAADRAGMPASLLKRSVEAKAKATGASEASVLAEMLGDEPPAGAETQAAPEEAPAAAEVVEMPTPAAEQPAAPEPMKAEPMKAEPTQAEPPRAEPPAPAAAVPGGAAVATAVRPTAPAETAPEGVRTQRLLTVVKAKAIQQVKAEPTDKVNTWPHLMIAEFAVLLGVTALLIVMSVSLQAPLLEAANFNATPNPSKAPWYFLGLQELLSYFDPQIAGVTVPTIVGLIGFMAIPYVDRNPSNKPSDRKFAIFMYTYFIMGAATLTILGVLFRGPGFNFTYPWSDGVYFDDIKDWVNLE